MRPDDLGDAAAKVVDRPDHFALVRDGFFADEVIFTQVAVVVSPVAFHVLEIMRAEAGRGAAAPATHVCGRLGAQDKAKQFLHSMRLHCDLRVQIVPELMMYNALICLQLPYPDCITVRKCPSGKESALHLGILSLARHPGLCYDISRKVVRMRTLKRVLYYAILNIGISALTVWVVLNIWERRNPDLPAESTPQVIVVTATSGLQIPVPVLPATEPATAWPQEPTTLETPLPTPTLELVEYIVQAGDTLGTIAAQFEISVADIIDVNNLENPDVLSVGQVLYIPIGGLVIPTETIFPPTIVASPTPRTTATPGHPQPPARP